MALGNRHVKLDSRTARMKLLPRHAAYWSLISPSCSLGYRRGNTNNNGVWIAKYSPSDGRRVQTRLGAADDNLPADGVLCLDYLRARRKAAEWFSVAAQIATGEVSRRGGYTVQEACADYLARLNGRSKSYRVTRYVLEASVQPVLGGTLVEKLSRSRIEAWHRDLALSPRRQPANGLDPQSEEAIRRRRDTANRYLVALKAALNRAVSEGKVASTGLAWKLVKPFKGVGNARTRFLSDQEARKLVGVCEPEFRALIQGALLTGCRYSELCALLVHDFNEDSSTLLVAQSKAGKSRRVYLDAEATAFFSFISMGKPADHPLFKRKGNSWKKDGAQGLMDDACRLAEIPRATFHELRHTAASRWARLGLSLQEIAAQLGHADVRMTQRYAHLCQHTMAEKLKLMPRMGIANVLESTAAEDSVIQ